MGGPAKPKISFCSPWSCHCVLLFLVLCKFTAIHPFFTSVTYNILGLEHRSFYSRNNWQFIPVLSIKRTRRNLKQTIPWIICSLCKGMLRKQLFVETDINHKKANDSYFNATCIKCNSVQGSAIPW